MKAADSASHSHLQQAVQIVDEAIEVGQEALVVQQAGQQGRKGPAVVGVLALAHCPRLNVPPHFVYHAIPGLHGCWVDVSCSVPVSNSA